MTTPISTSIPFCSGPDIRSRHDFRQAGDLLNDDGTRVTTAAAFDANSEVTTGCMDASGMVEMYCLKGNKYSVAELQSLTGASRNLLVKICVELAWWGLWERRHAGKPMLSTALWAFSVCESLESGAIIFGIQEKATAGNPSNDFYTSADDQAAGRVAFVAKRFFGRHPETNRLGGGGCSDPCGCQ